MGPKAKIAARYRRPNGTMMSAAERAVVNAQVAPQDSRQDDGEPSRSRPLPLSDFPSGRSRSASPPRSRPRSRSRSLVYSVSPSRSPPSLRKRDRFAGLRDLCMRCHKDATNAAIAGSSVADPPCAPGTARSLRCATCANGRGRKSCERLPDIEEAKIRALALQDSREACYNETSLSGVPGAQAAATAREALDRLVTFVSRDVGTQGMRKLKRNAVPVSVGVGAGVEGELRELRQQLRTQHNEMMEVLERIAGGSSSRPRAKVAEMSGGLGSP